MSLRVYHPYYHPYYYRPLRQENEAPAKKGDVATSLYQEMPETLFTRSISNPEAVMKRRRQMKLERKLQQFKSSDGGPDTGNCPSSCIGGSSNCIGGSSSCIGSSSSCIGSSSTG